MKLKLNDVEIILSELENQEDIQLQLLYKYINALGISEKIASITSISPVHFNGLSLLDGELYSPAI